MPLLNVLKQVKRKLIMDKTLDVYMKLSIHSGVLCYHWCIMSAKAKIVYA